ncbi:MAG: response regulator [Limisphaerales bacterium]
MPAPWECWIQNRFRLLILDLKMPRMDGLQVLSVVRRRYPELRTVILSGLEEEELRSRAYALGADLFWLKNDMQRDSKMFMDCLESLLGRDVNGGFRGIQSKGLMDIIQMECLSRSSTVLRVTRGPLVAKLWFENGELLDAEAEGARGEVAFRRILAWKSGTFENLPAEPGRKRTITKPINALLLESAQVMDESANLSSETQIVDARHRNNVWKLSLLLREGAEFVIAIPPEGQGEPEAMGTRSTDLAAWTRHATDIARRLGDKVEAGPLMHLIAHGLEKKFTIVPDGKKTFSSAGRWRPPANNCSKTANASSPHGILRQHQARLSRTRRHPATADGQHHGES